MCPVCRGRGEVAAGITSGIVEYGPAYDCIDWKGRVSKQRAAYPASIYVNPDAWDEKNKCIWIVEENPLCSLWGIAVCMKCSGTGEVDTASGYPLYAAV